MNNDTDLIITDDDIARRLLLDSARMLQLKIAADIERIANDDFSDDDTDYMPARAATLSNIIAALANIDITPADALATFIAPAADDPITAIDYASTDLDTTDFTTPLLTYRTLHDPDYSDDIAANRELLAPYFD